MRKFSRGNHTEIEQLSSGHPCIMRTSHHPLLLLLLLSVLLVGCFGRESGSGKAVTPNIVLILADDHAFQALSCYQDHLIKTPNIDRIGNEGVRFERAFVTNSVCAPARATILTGKFSHLNGQFDNRTKFDSTQVTFPKILRSEGYRTSMIGKWHLKSLPVGFDFWKILKGQGYYYDPEFLSNDEAGGEPRQTVEEGYVTDKITDFALDWLDTVIGTEEPFFLLYSQQAPHRKWLPALRHLPSLTDGPTPGAAFPEPSTLFDDYQGRGTAARDAEMRIKDHMSLSFDNKLPPDLVDSLGFDEFYEDYYRKGYESSVGRMKEDDRKVWDQHYQPIAEEFASIVPKDSSLVRWKYQRYMQDYLGTIRALDENVGRLLNYLDEKKLSDNTLVIYVSDQGFYLGEHGWFDKRFMYEPSLRTPLLVRYPRMIKPGAVNNNLVQNLDISSTILDFAGLEVPKEFQGASLKPLLLGQDTPWRNSIYYHYYEYPGEHAVKKHYGVRTGRHKLIHFYHDIDEWELYDLEVDPDEMKNVYEDSSYFEVRQDLEIILEDLRLKYKDTLAFAG